MKFLLPGGLRAAIPPVSLLLAVPLLSCGGHATPGPGNGVAIRLTTNSTRFVTREHFLAAAEMQISGEPLALAMKRTLSNYSRDHFPPNVYFDSSPLSPAPWTDLAGFATAVESYEYSKQPMNNVAMESGAGTSLLYGPLFNGSSGTAALGAVADLVQLYAQESHGEGRFVFPAGTFPISPDVSGDPNLYGVGLPSENPLGWPGFWPTVHVFQSFDPTITPVADGTSIAPSPPTTTRGRREGNWSATTSATTPGSTFLTGHSRWTSPSPPVRTASAAGNTASGFSTTWRSCTTPAKIR